MMTPQASVFARSYCNEYNNPSWRDFGKAVLKGNLNAYMVTPCLMFANQGKTLYCAFFDARKCKDRAMMKQTLVAYKKEIQKYSLAEGFETHPRFTRYFV